MTEPKEQPPFPFEPSDVCMLKSDGPTMVIEEIVKSKCHCVWFAESVVMRDWFFTDTLVLPPPEE